VLIEVKAAAINPSDIKNVQGKMHLTTVPRIPGRDFAGLIVKGVEGQVVGQPVFGSGGDLGFGAMVAMRNMWQFLLPRWSLCQRT
jgi:NADPH:quinone reductase